MEHGEAPWNEDDYVFDRRRLTIKKKERTDDPDYEQPQVHLHSAPQAIQGPQGAPVSATGHQSAFPKPDVCCLVKGCHADLTNSKAYYRRFRICEAHMKSLSLSIEGRSCRFCQQCGKFHLVEEFDGANRNCRKALMIRFYKRRNLPLTHLQAACGRGADAQAPTAAASATAPAPAPQQELRLEPRKRGRPRAPRPDIKEEDPAVVSGGSRPGSPPPGGDGAARAAAAAGFDSALQAAYMAASRGYQGASGLGVSPATAIGPPGYSQGGVRMAGIEIDEMDDEFEPPLPLGGRRRRGGGGGSYTSAVAAAEAELGAQDLKLRRAQRRAQQDAATLGPPGLLGAAGEPMDFGYLPHDSRGSGSLSHCSSSHSQDQDAAQGRRGGPAAAAAAAPLGRAAVLQLGGSGGGAADVFTALGGALAPLLESGLLPAATAQVDLSSLLSGLGSGGLLQALPPPPAVAGPGAAGGEGPRQLQELRPPHPGGLPPEEAGGWRGAAADDDAVQAISSRPSRTSTRSSDGPAAAAAAAGGGAPRRSLKLNALVSGLPSPHRQGMQQLPADRQEVPPSSDEQLLQPQQLQQLLARGGSGASQQQQQQHQQQRGSARYGKAGGGGSNGAPPSMAVIKREGVEVIAGPPTSGAAVPAAANAAAAAQEQDDVHRGGARLALRDTAAAGGRLTAAAAATAEARRQVGGSHWGVPDQALDVALGPGHGAGEGGLSGRVYDRDRDLARGPRDRDWNREILGLDLSGGAGRAGGGGGGLSSTLLLGQQQHQLQQQRGGGLAVASGVDSRRGSEGAATDALPLDVVAAMLLNPPPRGQANGGRGGAFSTAAAAAGGSGVQYFRLEPALALAMQSPSTPLRLSQGGGAGGAGFLAVDEEKRNAAVARLLSQLPVGQQLDLLQQMPADQMLALLQVLPHTQQVKLLLELQDERRQRILQERQQQQQHFQQLQIMQQLKHISQLQQQQQQQPQQQQQQQPQQHQLVLLSGRGSASGGGDNSGSNGGGGGRAALALDLALDPAPSAASLGSRPRQQQQATTTAAAAAAGQRIAVEPVALPQKPLRPPAPVPLSYNPQQHQQQHELLLQHHRQQQQLHQQQQMQLEILQGAEAAEAIAPLELVSLAGAGTRLQRMPDGSEQFVLQLPVAATTAAGAATGPAPVLRLQPPAGTVVGGAGAGAGAGMVLGAAVQLAAKDVDATGGGGVDGGGGAALSLSGDAPLLLNLSSGSVRLPGNALVLRGSGGGASQGGARASSALPTTMLSMDYGGGAGGGGAGGGGGEDALERLSVKLHGVRPEHLAPDVAQRMRTWLLSMDAVTLQGTLRSGCVNLVLDVNIRSPPPPPQLKGRRRRAPAAAAGMPGGAAAPPPPPPPPPAPDQAASGARPVPACTADRLAAAALAAALGLDVHLENGGGGGATAAVAAAAAAMGVRAQVQVGCQVVYPPSGARQSDAVVPVVHELAPLAIVRGEPAVLHMVGDSLGAAGARLHVRLNGRRLAALVQPEEEPLGPCRTPLPHQGPSTSPPPAPPAPEPSPPPCTAPACEGPSPPPPLPLPGQVQAGPGEALRVRRYRGDARKAACIKPCGSGKSSGCSATESAGEVEQITNAATGLQWRPPPRRCGLSSGSASDVRAAVVGRGGGHGCTSAAVFLDPPEEAGLAAVEWEAGGGGGELGCWKPLLVAPTAEVAAEVNALAEAEAQPPLPRHDECAFRERTLAAAGAPTPGLGEGEEAEGAEAHEDAGGGSPLHDACWLHQLLTDLGLVLDALHNCHSSSSSSCGSSSTRRGGNDAGSTTGTPAGSPPPAGCSPPSDSGEDESAWSRRHPDGALPLMPAAAAAAAAAALGVDEQVLSCYVRRAKRLLPFCLARSMPYTASEVLRFLVLVARVPVSELLLTPPTSSSSSQHHPHYPQPHQQQQSLTSRQQSQPPYRIPVTSVADTAAADAGDQLLQPPYGINISAAAAAAVWGRDNDDVEAADTRWSGDAAPVLAPSPLPCHREWGRDCWDWLDCTAPPASTAATHSAWDSDSVLSSLPSYHDGLGSLSAEDSSGAGGDSCCASGGDGAGSSDTGGD